MINFRLKNLLMLGLVLLTDLSYPVAAQYPSPVKLVVVRQERRVFVYQSDELVVSYPIAIGKPGWETPLGDWKITDKISNPGWTSFLTGRVMAPGKNNPMGSMWVGFYKDRRGEIGFHGTQNISSLGKAVSHGCLRMREQDVQDLAKRVDVGTEVQVVDKLEAGAKN
jgi:lipoprotein-anchoring transpeptidase ErfK/SrfK